MAMALPDWLYVSASAVRKRRIPTRRRRARWLAEREFEKAIAELRPGDIAIDCGANIGVFTQKMAATGATVYAFEPDPYAFEILSRNFAVTPNVNLSSAAVGVQAGKVHLFRSADFKIDPLKATTSSSVFDCKKNVDADAKIEVEQIDLCNFIESIDRNIYLLKLDIEGAEVSLIEKILDTGIISKIKYIFAETHEKQIPELSSRIIQLKKRIELENLSQVNLDWQ